MEDLEPLSGEKSQPEEKRHGPIFQVFWQAVHGLQVSLLENVGRIDPTLEPVVQAQTDHELEPVPVTLEQLAQGLQTHVSLVCRGLRHMRRRHS
jgi:hypothetical protein